MPRLLLGRTPHMFILAALVALSAWPIASAQVDCDNREMAPEAAVMDNCFEATEPEVGPRLQGPGIDVEIPSEDGMQSSTAGFPEPGGQLVVTGENLEVAPPEESSQAAEAPTPPPPPAPENISVSGPWRAIGEQGVLRFTFSTRGGGFTGTWSGGGGGGQVSGTYDPTSGQITNGQWSGTAEGIAVRGTWGGPLSGTGSGSGSLEGQGGNQRASGSWSVSRS